MPIILVIEAGTEVIRKSLSSRPLILGRSSKCHVKLTDAKISGTHLSAHIGKDGKTIIKDLETTNGTYINGSKIMESHFFIDDELFIGDIKIFLDPDEMGPKEKSNHTREGEKTQHTFIKLPSDPQSAVQEAMTKAKNSQAEKAKPGTFKNESARQKEILELLKKDNAPEKSRVGLKTRVLNKVKFLSKKTKSEVIDEVRTGENFDLEASSGETKMLKIEKTKKNKKR